jgi:hypothetical protein
MATLSATHPTLLDVTKRLDPNGKVDAIVEMLNQTNEVLDDCVWLEANGATGHRTTIRSGLPVPTWRKLYGGVQPTKSTTVQVTESMGMLEAYAEVDKALADLNNNAPEFRLSEDRAHIEGMNQEFTSSLFYANEATAPEEFTGLAPRFNSTSAENGSQIIKNGTPDGSDNTSIWLVVWGPNTAHCIYPKGSTAGLAVTDKGQVTVENVDGAGGRAEMYRSHYRWDVGLSVRDWRYIVRILVNQEDLTKNAATGDDLVDLMTQAAELVPSLSMGRPVFYMNRGIRSFLRRQIVNKVASSTLKTEDVAGKQVTMFGEIPCRRCDALTNTETGF